MAVVSFPLPVLWLPFLFHSFRWIDNLGGFLGGGSHWRGFREFGMEVEELNLAHMG